MNLRISYFIVLFALCLTSCLNKKDNSQKTVKIKIDTISYTGNAVAFFSEDTRKMIRFIPVKEKDSTKFKQLDVFQSIKDQPIYCIYIGGYLNRLLRCKEKQILKREICKYGYASYYVKIWISYRNYLAGPERPGIPDSCRVQALDESIKISKLIDIKPF